jgi:hypothetical protein
MLLPYTMKDLCKVQRYLESKIKSSLLIDIIFKLLFYIIMCSIVMPSSSYLYDRYYEGSRKTSFKAIYVLLIYCFICFIFLWIDIILLMGVRWMHWTNQIHKSPTIKLLFSQYSSNHSQPHSRYLICYLGLVSCILLIVHARMFISTSVIP